MSTIGERIREIRKEKKLTQVELGQLLGISGAGVSYIESGGSQPTEAAVKLICATYHVSYKWLTEGVGPMFEELMPDERFAAFVDQHAPDADPYFKGLAVMASKYWTDQQWEMFRGFVDSLKAQLDQDGGE